MQNTRKIITSARLGEEYTKVEHSSGLKILLYPMAGYNSAYALFATKYGSVDNVFKTSEETDFAKVPEGIAHFLEHKMFECEDGDAFAKYAATGASANAYTSFDRTAYLFSCTENFKESLDILLDFVSRPYFTPETVQKEQGIIGQEIKMYDDSPEWRVFSNMLGAMYHEHPLKVDIVGTTDSIAKIDADILYRCYNTFYNLNNMVLCVAGGFMPEEVLESADRILKPSKDVEVQRGVINEPETVVKDYCEQSAPVALPLFHLGFKGTPGSESENMMNQIIDDLLSDIIAGESTPLYRRLYDEGLINTEFAGEAMSSRDFSLAIFAGESRDPRRVRDEILAEITRIKSEGIDPETFRRYKKAAYGGYMSMFGRVESVASFMLTTHFSGAEPYEILEAVAALTLEDAEKRLKVAYDPKKSVLSVITPSVTLDPIRGDD